MARSNRCTRHIASGSIQKRIYAPIAGENVIAILLKHLRIKHVGDVETCLATFCNDIGNNLLSLLLATAKDSNFGTFRCEIFTYAGAEHTGTPGYDHDFIFY